MKKLLFAVILIGLMRVTFAQTDCVDINYSETFYDDFGEFTAVDAFGDCSWFWYSSYHCAYVNSYNCETGDDDWLISPSFDLSEMVSASFSFTQACSPPEPFRDSARAFSQKPSRSAGSARRAGVQRSVKLRTAG